MYTKVEPMPGFFMVQAAMNCHTNLTCCTAHLFRLTSKAVGMDPTPNIVHIKKKEICIGRDQNSVDVYLNSAYIPHVVSRVHAYISRSFGKWRIRDNRSSNGVFVNCRKIVDQAQLNDGDLLVFGSIRKYCTDRSFQQDRGEYRYVFRINYLDPENGCDRSQSDGPMRYLADNGGGRPKRPRVTLDASLYHLDVNPCINHRCKRANRRGHCFVPVANATSMMLVLNAAGEGGTLERARLPYASSSRDAAVSMHILMEGESSPDALRSPALGIESATCFICLKVAVNRVMLPCMHSFCSSCLGFWLQQSRRRQSCDGSSGNCDGSTASVREHLSDVALERDVLRLELPPCLMSRVDRVVNLQLGSPWNERDRHIFFDLLACSKDVAGFSYCRVLGLTPRWVESASDADIIIACDNLSISVAKVAYGRAENARSSPSDVMAALRSELLQIIHSNDP